MNSNELEEIENLLEWLDKNNNQLINYMPAILIQNKALLAREIFNNIAYKIRNNDKVAIKIACDFIIADKKIPFGRCIKSEITRALKSKADLISKADQMAIILITKKLLILKYTPSEVKFYCNLISKFGSKYCDIILSIEYNDIVTRKYKEYLLMKCNCM